jgi:hypothetical protein
MPPAKQVPDEQKVAVQCAVTGRVVKVNPRVDGTPSIPMGWKIIKGKAYSSEGVQKAFVRLSHTISVAGVALGYGPDGWPTNEAAAAAWKEFRKAFRVSSRQSAELMNEAMRRMVLADTAPVERKEDGGFKLPAYPATPGLYEALRREYPDVDSQTVGSLLIKVRSRYNEDRFDVRVRRSMSVPSFKVPAPVPCPPAEIYTAGVDGQLLLVKLRMAGQRFTLRLAGGSNWERQTKGIREAMAEGDLGEVVVREVAVADYGNQPKARKGNGPGRNMTPTRLMVTVAVLVPRPKKVERTGTLRLSTGGSAFWHVTINGTAQPPYHESQALRWGSQYRRMVAGAPAASAGHADDLQGFADDQKHDRRFPRRERLDIQGAREKAVRRYRHQISDLCNKMVRSIILLCQRRRIGTVVYEDTDRSYMPSFPWFRLRNQLRHKLEAENIDVTVVGPDDNNQEDAAEGAEQPPAE